MQNRPPLTARTIVNTVALTIAIVAVGLMVSRGVWVLAYPQWAVIGGLCAVIVLISSIGLLDAMRGRVLRAWLLVAVEAAVSVVVFMELGLSWERASQDVPVLGPYLALHVWAPRATDPYQAAAYRVYGSGGQRVLDFVGYAPSAIVALGQCPELRAGYTAYVAGREPLVEQKLDRALGACAAHDGDAKSALRFYFGSSATPDGNLHRISAAQHAEQDGFDDVATSELTIGFSGADPRQRTEICTFIAHMRKGKASKELAELLEKAMHSAPPPGCAKG
jgi:hypothetical protein